MRFDDRLLTVLSQPVGDRHDAAVRWRQLVDLVARAGAASSSPVVLRAIDAIRADAPGIDEELRAAAARAIAGRPLPMGLLEYLVSDRLAVSAPVLAAASLHPQQWAQLLEHADEETRRFIETLHPQAAGVEAPPQQQAEPPAQPVQDSAPDAKPQQELPAAHAEARPRDEPPAAPSLGELVARIERRRRTRNGQPYPDAEPAHQEAPSLFRWECGPSGEIAWVEGAPRGALIGRSIARVQDSERVDEEVVRAFARRAPFRDGEMIVPGEGLVAGTWKISGLPAFDPTDGRFAGYRGVAQRESAPEENRKHGTADVLSDPDSLRELVHEIKTPLNAIIGFAEIIQGQFLGPADHRYRERAGEIVGQARLLLSAIDDLDFAAKIHSAPGSLRRVDLTALFESSRDLLGEAAARRDLRIELVTCSPDCVAALEPEIADRLIGRFVTALINLADPGEHLRIAVERGDADCRISVSRPAALRNVPDALLFEGLPETEKRTDFSGVSAGFSLRLVRGLARITGGDLVISPASFTLVFPRA